MMNIRSYLLPLNFGILLSALSLFLCSPASARDILLLGGTEGSVGDGSIYNYYAYVSIIAPLSQNRIGDGFVQKYWLDYLGYNYMADSQEIDATGIGIEGALGYQFSGASGWGGAYIGIRYSDTRLSPDNPDSRVRGSQLWAKIQLEGEKKLDPGWKINGIGSYILALDGYWIRGRVMYRTHNEVFTGPEIVSQGDPEYRAWQWGWFITGFEPMPNMDLGVKAGIRRTEKAESGVYLGVELSRSYQ